MQFFFDSLVVRMSLVEQKFKGNASFASGGRGGDGVLFKAPICQQMQSRTAPFQALWPSQHVPIELKQI